MRFTRRLRRITTEKVIAIYIFLLITTFLIDYKTCTVHRYVLYTCLEMNLSPVAYFTWKLVLSLDTHRHTAVGLVIVESHDNYECVLFLLLTSDIWHLITALHTVFFFSARRIPYTSHTHGQSRDGGIFVSFLFVNLTLTGLVRSETWPRVPIVGSISVCGLQTVLTMCNPTPPCTGQTHLNSITK